MKFRANAAAMFRDLILKGGMTDREIFEAVRKRCGVHLKYYSRVAWYRAELRRLGYKPAGAIKKERRSV